MSVDRIPLANLNRQYEAIGVDVERAMTEVIDSKSFVRGPVAGAFEKAFADYSDAEACLGCGNGTDALYLALNGFGIGPGDQVITVSHTFVGTIEGIMMTGAEPVFVDVEDETMLMDPALLEAALTKRTKAIVPVHLYGQPCDMTAINALAEKHGLFVIEDAAQAHGARWRGRRAGGLGHAAAFSFFPGKNLGAYGDGGAVTSNDVERLTKIRDHANHGRLDKYTHSSIGINSRLDALQAAVLGVKLQRLDDWNARRRAIAARYDEFFDARQVRRQRVAEGAEPVYHLYVIRVPAEQRDNVVEQLNERGIDVGVHYPVPLHRQPAMEGHASARSQLPVTERVAGEVISLPVFPEMTDAEIDKVMTSVIDAL